MKRVAVMLANGCEELEALTPVDVIRRAGAECVTFALSDMTVTGSHGIVFKADDVIENFKPELFDAIVLPGGMPGAKILGESRAVLSAVNQFDAQGKIVAAICAAPAVVLGVNGLICGRRVTCYPAPDFIRILDDAKYTAADVEVDGNLITACGPKAAMTFALTICEKLNFTPAF